MTEGQIIRQLLKDFEALKKENARLVLRVAELEDRLSKYENPKNSKKSSVPPSQESNRVTKKKYLPAKPTSIRPVKSYLGVLAFLLFEESLLLLYRHSATIMAPAGRAKDIHQLIA